MNEAETHESWEPLLRRWHTGLVITGVVGSSWDYCIIHFTESVLFYLSDTMSLSGLFDTGNERGTAVATAYTTRIFSHVLDIDVL